MTKGATECTYLSFLRFFDFYD